MDKETRKSHFVELTQYMSLSDKVKFSKNKISEFLDWCYENKEPEILIAFSGGKDSTLLFELVADVTHTHTHTGITLRLSHLML